MQMVKPAEKSNNNRVKEVEELGDLSNYPYDEQYNIENVENSYLNMKKYPKNIIP